MKRKYNERNAQLMAKYGASPELMATTLELKIDECRRIIEANALRLLTLKATMADLETAIACAIRSAHAMQEESWLESEGEYTTDIQLCFMVACEQQGLPSRLWYVLGLAEHWSNDLIDWANNPSEYVPRSFVDEEDVTC